MTALVYLKNNLDKVKIISFDHDLGGDDTSRPVIKYLEEKAFFGKLPDMELYIHSANPVGREYLESAIQQICRWQFTAGQARFGD